MKSYKLISLPNAKNLSHLFTVGHVYDGKPMDNSNGVVLYFNEDSYIVTSSMVEEIK